jgi:hypothetical protein
VLPRVPLPFPYMGCGSELKQDITVDSGTDSEPVLGRMDNASVENGLGLKDIITVKFSVRI